MQSHVQTERGGCDELTLAQMTFVQFTSAEVATGTCPCLSNKKNFSMSKITPVGFENSFYQNLFSQLQLNLDSFRNPQILFLLLILSEKRPFF